MELNLSNETATTEYSVNYSTGSRPIPSETSTTVLTTTTQTSPQSNDNPIGIKIKEITKPEEIRITGDNRPTVYKTIKTSEAIATKTSSALHSTETLIEPEYEAPLAIITDENSEIQPEIEPEIEQHTFFYDGSADQPIQLESTDLNNLGHVSMGPKIVRQTDIGMEDETDTTLSPFSSENVIKDETLTTTLDHVTEGPIESTSIKHNTSVLQVGDSVFILDRSGQTQSIHLRVAGLQRGEDTYDEEDEHKEGRKADEAVQFSTAESENSSMVSIFEPSSSSEVYEVFYYELKDNATASLDFPSEINTASGEGFISDVELNDDSKEGSTEVQNVGTSTEKLLEDIENSSGYSPLDRFTDPMLAQQSTVDEKTMSYYFEGSSSTSEEVSTNFDSFATSTGSSPLYSSEPTTTDADDDLVQHDQNINFPHITDDLSIHGSRMEDRMEDEDKLRVNSRIVDGELDKIEQNSIITGDDLNKSQDNSMSTTAPFEYTNFNDVEGRSPGEPFLIPEWERNHTTVAPFELFSSSSNETTEDHSLAGISSQDNHSIDTVVGDESTTSQSYLSSSIDTDRSTSESDAEVESIETQSTSGPSQVRETNHLNLLLDGTEDFFRIQKKIWNSAVV